MTERPDAAPPKKKPTIAELEAMIEDGAEPHIAPDGEITVEHPKVHRLEDVLAPLPSDAAPVAWREAAEEILAADTAEMILRANPGPDKESEMDLWDAMELRRRNAINNLRGALDAHPEDAPGGPSETEAKLRHALIEHRADLHGGSNRPCPTCRESAEALGIASIVPDQCARKATDRKALDRLKGEGETDG